MQENVSQKYLQQLINFGQSYSSFPFRAAFGDTEKFQRHEKSIDVFLLNDLD